MNRVLFLGQKVIAERCLALLARPEYAETMRVGAVVSAPDFYEAAAAGRSFDPAPRFIPNAERNEAEILGAVESLGLNLLLSVQHPWVLSEQVLRAVGGRAFNLHNAKLPEYKGHNSISHAILNGDSSYTTTIHWMSPRVDMGDIAYEETFPIRGDDTAWSLYGRSVGAAAKNFQKLLDALAARSDVPRRGITSEGRFYRRAEIQALKEIGSPGDAAEVDRKARAFYFPPFEPAYFVLGGKKFYVSTQSY